MRKLTKEEFEKYIKDAAEYKFRPNPAFMTEEFYKANKEYFDEIGVVGVFKGEPVTFVDNYGALEDYREHNADEINKIILPLLNVPEEE